VAEWLGSGLQSRVQQFESAHHLQFQNKKRDHSVPFFIFSLQVIFRFGFQRAVHIKGHDGLLSRAALKGGESARSADRVQEALDNLLAPTLISAIFDRDNLTEPCPNCPGAVPTPNNLG
jgi:hypothetical protein